MIKFFRKIRHEMLNENKTSQYLKYAIGEIALVVIGILIALSLNNWNENRQKSIIEQETLISLKSDLESALIQLNDKIRQNEDYRSYDSILLHTIHFKIDLTSDSLESLALRHIFSPGFDPELGTLNEILNTGKMGIIKNRVLRNHISTWNKYMDELTEVDEKLEHFNLRVKEPLYSKEIPMKNRLTSDFNTGNESYYDFPKSNLDWNSEALLQNREFENMLSNYMIFSSIQHVRLLDIKQKINEMITLINQDTADDKIL